MKCRKISTTVHVSSCAAESLWTVVCLKQDIHGKSGKFCRRKMVYGCVTVAGVLRKREEEEGLARMEKQQILVVDDSALNREILSEMLSDDYWISEAKNGQEAIELLVNHWREYRLVLLDINMPVVDGYEVLRYMKAHNWLEVLPVIAISAETGKDNIGLAYELGVSDYFKRPFDSSAVRRRVRNTIALYDKMAGNLQDAVGMLASFFLRILKINLTTDSYWVLKNSETEETGVLDRIEKFSERLKAYVYRGDIYPDDIEEYLQFFDLERLRRFFADGNQQTKLHVRYRNGQEYRWVSMEMLRSTEYQSDEQFTMLYMRDIHDDYIKQLDIVMRHVTDSSGVVNLNVSQNRCISASGLQPLKKVEGGKESIDSYIGRIAEDILIDKDKKSFCEIFCRDHLLACYKKGKNSVVVEQSLFCKPDKKLKMYRITVETFRNSCSNEIEGVLYFTDITDSYLSDAMLSMVYEKSYEMIALIDMRREMIVSNYTKHFSMSQYLEGAQPYREFAEKRVKNRVAEKDRRMIAHAASLNVIRKELEKSDTYSFTLQLFDKNGQGERRLKRCTFLYLSKPYQIVLSTLEDITDLTGRDVLTGGYNREGFLRHVKERLKEAGEERFAVLYFNIKSFKAVNELFGTEKGDSVLRTLYKTLNTSELHPEITARIEADHFACLVRTENLNFNILTALCEQRVVKERKTLHLHLRCGVFFAEDRTMPVDGMLSRAKLAKRYIKDEYIQPYRVYDRSMSNAYLDSAELAGELCEGIQKKQFEVYYQPVVDAGTGEIASAEALIRWNHPEKGMISPGIFIPALEESGQISELSLYVIEQVKEFIRSRICLGLKVVPVSINLSWMDFYDETMIQSIIAQLQTEEIPRGMIRFEITETSYAALEENRLGVLNAMRKENAKILLDDFGSGYSSFGMLREYNFDILKIDMSFVRQIETNTKTRSILRFLIDMAHEMDVSLIAEGAETEAQARFLKENGCDYIQGYYYSRPVPQEAFRKLLDAGKALPEVKQ